MGAYSYVRSGSRIYIARRLGRYCSMVEGDIRGDSRNHPVDLGIPLVLSVSHQYKSELKLTSYWS